jgi:hypothetical protein
MKCRAPRVGLLLSLVCLGWGLSWVVASRAVAAEPGPGGLAQGTHDRSVHAPDTGTNPVAVPDDQPVVLSRAVEDSVMQLVSQGQTLLIRETEPRSAGNAPPKDHPQAWQCFVDALDILLRVMGARALDDSRGPAYLNLHGLRINVQHPYRLGYPVLLTFYNDARGDETACFLIDRFAGRHVIRRLLASPSGSWAGQAVRAWSQGGGEYAAVQMQGLGANLSQCLLLVLRREGETWQTVSTHGVETFGERVTLGFSQSREGFPGLDVVQLEDSKLFESAPGSQTVQFRSRYEVRADTLVRQSRSLDPSYFGPSTWVMESLARGHREWAQPYVARPALLDSLAALAWPKAKSGWRLEHYSQRFDTLIVSHPAVGRMTMFSGMDGPRRVLLGCRLESAAAPRPAHRRPPGKARR